MTRHRLPATRENVVNVFDRDTPPVLTVDPGDTVVVDSLDAAGFLEPMRTPHDTGPTMFEGRIGHCLTGPVAVRGAAPGAVLAVRVGSLEPGTWGWTLAGGRDTPLNRRLGLANGPETGLLWDIRDGTATDGRGRTVTTAPFLGVIGVPPAAPGPHSTLPPRAEGGGNIDCRELVAGSTLYLPVTVPGALLHLGDGHAAQGNGEVAGTAIECPMTTEVTLDLVEDPPVPGLHAETPEGRITFGIDPDLDTAAAGALDAMLSWMCVLFDTDRRTALALAGGVLDLRVTQVASAAYGVHAVLPHGALRTP